MLRYENPTKFQAAKLQKARDELAAYKKQQEEKDIIDQISITSDAVVVNKISYKEDLTNAREAIKRLGQYDLRKKELERQKKILINKNDEISLRALKKIEKFETIGELNFTHVIIADYNIRLL